MWIGMYKRVTVMTTDSLSEISLQRSGISLQSTIGLGCSRMDCMMLVKAVLEIGGV
jgi:hypothetical protein